MIAEMERMNIRRRLKDFQGEIGKKLEEILKKFVHNQKIKKIEGFSFEFFIHQQLTVFFGRIFFFFGSSTIVLPMFHSKLSQKQQNFVENPFGDFSTSHPL
jgi:hypothetical protein